VILTGNRMFLYKTLYVKAGTFKYWLIEADLQIKTNVA